MKLKYTFEILELDDQPVAVVVGKGASEFRGVLKLNETSKVIFEHLMEETSVEEIVDAMEAEFDVPRESLKADVQKFVQFCEENNILTT